MPSADQIYDEAMQLKDAGQLDDAVAKLREALVVDPNHVTAHSAMAVYLQKLGKADEAIKHAVQAAQLDPQNPFSFVQLSVIYQRCGKIPEAEEAMARANMLRSNPGPRR